MKHRFDLEGQTAVVTGAAGGIGHALCATFLASGARVAALDVDGDRVQALADELSGTAANCRGYAVDVRAPADLQRVANEVERDFGPVGVLVANAGVVTMASALDVTEADWDQVIDVDLKGVFLTCQTFGRHMVDRRSGSIVLTASSWSIVGFKDRAPYVAAKTGVLGLMRALALEWGPKGVRVNAVCPILVRTPMVERLLADREYRDAMLGRIPLGRLNEPADVAAAVLYLASPAASMVHGHALVVDGGWTAQ